MEDAVTVSIVRMILVFGVAGAISVLIVFCAPGCTAMRWHGRMPVPPTPFPHRKLVPPLFMSPSLILCIEPIGGNFPGGGMAVHGLAGTALEFALSGEPSPSACEIFASIIGVDLAWLSSQSSLAIASALISKSCHQAISLPAWCS